MLGRHEEWSGGDPGSNEKNKKNRGWQWRP